MAWSAVLLTLWLLSGILLPFIVGMAAAYVLDPLADWLQRHGFARGPATLLITALFFAALALLLLVLLPVAIEQAIGLAAQAAGLLRRAAQPYSCTWSSGSSARAWSKAVRSRAWPRASPSRR